MTEKQAMEWLNETAIYFENRPTHGEDKAHWSNVYNADSARKISKLLERHPAEQGGMADDRSDLGYDRTGFSFPLPRLYGHLHENGHLNHRDSWDVLAYAQSCEVKLLTADGSNQKLRSEITELKSKLYDLQFRR